MVNLQQLKTLIQIHTQRLDYSELLTYYEKSKIRRIELVTYDNNAYPHTLIHVSSKDGKNFENLMESGKSNYHSPRIDFGDIIGTEKRQADYDREVERLRKDFYKPLRNYETTTIKEQQGDDS